MSKRIAMFNHKGGVAKTLLSYHIGWMLTNLGHKVLLVDGDSQVNLTAIALGVDLFDTYYENQDTKEKNIKDGVAPVFEGRPIALEAFDCPSAKGNENLIILPGHLELSQYEGQLSLAQETGGSLSVLQNLPGALSGLIERIEERHNVEFTIVDMNPGLGAINQNLFLMSNYFVVPTNPDPFSNMAIETLANRVSRWEHWRQQSIPIYADSLYPLVGGHTRFLGSITSRFNKHSSKAAARFDDRIRQIDETVRSQLIPKLRSAGMALDDDVYTRAHQTLIVPNPGSPTSKYCLARLPDFQSLAQIASGVEKPVFEITDDEFRQNRLGGGSLEQARANRGQFQQIFEAIGQKIEFLTNEQG